MKKMILFFSKKSLQMLLIFGACHQVVLANNVNDKEALKLFEKYSKDFENKRFVNFRFHQNVYKASRKRNVESHGHAFFSKPNKFRWTFEQPRSGEWIFDGTVLFHHEIAKKRAKSYSLDSSKMNEFQHLVHMILDSKALLSEFDLKNAKKGKDVYIFDMAPYKKSNIDHIQLHYDFKFRYLRKIEMGFAGGNKTTFSFSQPSFDSFPMTKFKLDSSVKVTRAL